MDGAPAVSADRGRLCFIDPGVDHGLCVSPKHLCPTSGTQNGIVNRRLGRIRRIAVGPLALRLARPHRDQVDLRRFFRSDAGLLRQQNGTGIGLTPNRNQRMSIKAKTRYQCSACGGVQSKWAGQCADCGAWNSLSEIATTRPNSPRFSSYAGESTVQRLVDVSPAEYAHTGSGMSELDRVLGGGIVRGSVVLIGGDPGIGK